MVEQSQDEYDEFEFEERRQPSLMIT